jgi:DNA-binding NtrC family response regulator
VPPHIVIVEDDEALSYVLGRTFELAGYLVTVFTDANAAWDSLKEGHLASLLLTDIHFPPPQPNGLALAAHARQRNTDLPVIFLTGHPELALLVEQQHRGPVFLKPLNMHAVEECVRDLVPMTT